MQKLPENVELVSPQELLQLVGAAPAVLPTRVAVEKKPSATKKPYNFAKEKKARKVAHNSRRKNRR